jgi:hypothetical protein
MLLWKEESAVDSWAASKWQLRPFLTRPRNCSQKNGFWRVYTSQWNVEKLCWAYFVSWLGCNPRGSSFFKDFDRISQRILSEVVCIPSLLYKLCGSWGRHWRMSSDLQGSTGPIVVLGRTWGLKIPRGQAGLTKRAYLPFLIKSTFFPHPSSHSEVLSPMKKYLREEWTKPQVRRQPLSPCSNVLSLQSFVQKHFFLKLPLLPQIEIK